MQMKLHAFLPESNSNDDDSIGAITGAVVGGIVGIIFITMLFSATLWYYCKQHKKMSTSGIYIHSYIICNSHM